MSFGVTGVADMQAQLHGLAFRARVVAGMALKHRADAVMDRSKEEFVPVKTGRLRETGRVDQVAFSGSNISVELKYGGPQAPYAILQHETPWFQHRVGQWKFLEQPLYEEAGSMLPQIAADMQGMLHGE